MPIRISDTYLSQIASLNENQVLQALPEEVLHELSSRYKEAFKLITSESLAEALGRIG